MRGRVLLVVGLVILLVAAGFGTEQLLVARHHDLVARRQQANYRAGHAAYLTGDCQTAIPALRKADVRRFSDLIAQQARTEQAACQDFQQISKYAEDDSPNLAAAVYVDYLRGDRPAPLVKTAQRRARQLLSSNRLHLGINDLCSAKVDLERFGIIRMKPDDALAAPFLQACAHDLAVSGDWPQARTTFLQLMHEFPRTTEGRSALKDLVAMSFTEALEVEPGEITQPSSTRSSVALNGKARLEVFYNSPAEFSVAGAESAFLQLDKCKRCPDVTTHSFSGCMQRAAFTGVEVKPGHYRIQVRYLDDIYAPDVKTDVKPAENAAKAVNYAYQGNANFAPNRLYMICFY